MAREAFRRARAAWWAARTPTAFPPGHYYSPVASIEEVRKRESTIFAVPESVAGVDLRPEAQLELVRQLRAHHATQPFAANATLGTRYYFENPYFSYGDAIVLHCMLRHLKPGRLVEVGSGYSSAVILDTVDQFLSGATKCTLIEPNPERLRSLVGDVDSTGTEVIAARLQDVDLALFAELSAGDVLFVDSTHVAKVGSDVNLLLHGILPMLAAGVVIHFHDIFYPFEYPRRWIDRGLSWNEAYMLRAFLAFNSEFEILLFSSYLAARHRSEVAEALPLWDRDPGSSIWLRRVERRSV